MTHKPVKLMSISLLSLQSFSNYFSWDWELHCIAIVASHLYDSFKAWYPNGWIFCGPFINQCNTSCSIYQTQATSTLIKDLHSNEMHIFFTQMLHQFKRDRIVRREGTGLRAEVGSWTEGNVQSQKVITSWSLLCHSNLYNDYV